MYSNPQSHSGSFVRALPLNYFLPPRVPKGAKVVTSHEIFQYLAADLGSASEQQPVEALCDQLLAYRAVAFDHRDRIVVQIPRHQLSHQRR